MSVFTSDLTIDGDYASLANQARALLAGESDRIANAANLAALIFQAVPNLNWAGFYFVDPRGDPVVGPFQGRPACVRIAPGSGVCGTALVSGRTQRVADVHEFEGHIACDPESRSEIVVPLKLDDRVIGVLDIDSPVAERFDERDQAAIELLAGIYLESIRKPSDPG
ncbi:MAG: GAF domain-containing protein [Xanthomonadaceae bacterium]|nr:GAF domain-containing protein [Xanthomonadaceae bacterium]